MLKTGSSEAALWISSRICSMLGGSGRLGRTTRFLFLELIIPLHTRHVLHRKWRARVQTTDIHRANATSGTCKDSRGCSVTSLSRGTILERLRISHLFKFKDQNSSDQLRSGELPGSAGPASLNGLNVVKSSELAEQTTIRSSASAGTTTLPVPKTFKTNSNPFTS